jgi:hypothetical protein
MMKICAYISHCPQKELLMILWGLASLKSIGKLDNTSGKS